MIGEIKDKIAYLNSLNPYEIIQYFTLDDVEHFIRSLGVTKIYRQKDYLVLPTICHNPIDSAESMKLYYYNNNKMFHCYTECGENMNIYELYQKVMALNSHSVDFYDAYLYIRQFLNADVILDTTNFAHADNIDWSQYTYKNQFARNDSYDIKILDLFLNYYHPAWLNEGITSAAMDKFKIKYSIAQNKIIIPHLDITGALIGIRGRALNQEEIDLLGKYAPIKYGDILYSHKLSQNLYGIYENQNAIKKYHRAIIVESEKSVLKDWDYSEGSSVVVACCGHNVNIYQVNLLISMGVTDITIAFDKEYDYWNDADGIKDRDRTIAICRKYLNKANFFYIRDYEQLLQKKDSPLDRGIDVWNKLYRSRIKVK